MEPPLVDASKKEVKPVLSVVDGTWVRLGRQPEVWKQLLSAGKLQAPRASGSVAAAAPSPVKPAVAVLVTVVFAKLDPRMPTKRFCTVALGVARTALGGVAPLTNVLVW